MSKTEYTPKYQVYATLEDYPGKRGRKTQPRTWERDRYYAFLKHRAQARFRNEQYELTEADWNELWTEHAWHQRGRSSDDLTLVRINALGPWHPDNVTVTMNRYKGDYYHPDRTPGGRPKGRKNKPKE